MSGVLGSALLLNIKLINLMAPKTPHRSKKVKDDVPTWLLTSPEPFDRKDFEECLIKYMVENDIIPKKTDKKPAEVTKEVFNILCTQAERFTDYQPTNFSVERPFIKPLRDKVEKALDWTDKNWNNMKKKYINQETPEPESPEPPAEKPVVLSSV